jgi:succinate dehydrogenase / fumarate reductase, membrane anchor subunit
MVKNGLTDWLIQRFTAFYMMLCAAALIIFLSAHPGLTFYTWHGLFQHIVVKVITVLFVISLLWHAFIGIWTVLTDYLQCGIARTWINALILFAFAGCLIAILFILWSL